MVEAGHLGEGTKGSEEGAPQEVETQPPGVLVTKKAKTIKKAGFVRPRKVVATKKPTARASGPQRRKKYLA